MNPTVYRMELSYTRQELLALFDFARQADVECGGRYDARSGALIVWSHEWQHAATWEESDVLGAFYVNCSPIGSGRSTVRRASASKIC